MSKSSAASLVKRFLVASSTLTTATLWLINGGAGRFASTCCWSRSWLKTDRLKP
eukprot:CAMPEP_0176005110 /NCGR_PEP_ID=MMETSP0120_2-20121206/2037_1 /TAXON_ID=160619 /ORGANISM="Kryptoperidinium foliaceum, Strain CCMP 1326" /LENGTH=53 /DNA_ID=CAMNT_0017337807 /DNA_START=355 /DNA_END=513 /DNA_ORIENTATION=+